MGTRAQGAGAEGALPSLRLRGQELGLWLLHPDPLPSGPQAAAGHVCSLVSLRNGASVPPEAGGPCRASLQPRVPPIPAAH